MSVSLQSEVIHNLAYALVQVVHNFGAVTVLGVYFATVLPANAAGRKRAEKYAFIGWAIQGISGASFAAVSYYFYRRFPDIGVVGQMALLIKILCVAAGFFMMWVYIRRVNAWSDSLKNSIWNITAGLAAIALTAAAFLRWFS